MKNRIHQTLRVLCLSALPLTAPGCADSMSDEPPDYWDSFGGDRGVDPSGPLPPPIIDDPDQGGTPAAPEVFANKQFAPQNLVVVDDSLHWVDFEANVARLRWVHTDGGDWLTVRDLDSLPFAAAADDAGLYLTASSQQHIVFAPSADLQPEPLHSSTSDPLAIALDDDHAYWTSADGCVTRGAKEGGDPENVACAAGSPISVALTDDFVFWATVEGNLFRAPKAVDAAPEKIASGESFPTGIVVDDSRVYWVNDATRQVRALTHSTGLIDVLAGAQYSPAGIAQDRFFLYFTTQGDGSVKKLSKSGGDTMVLAGQQSAPSEIAVDGEFIYWINEADSTIMRAVNR